MEVLKLKEGLLDSLEFQDGLHWAKDLILRYQHVILKDENIKFMLHHIILYI